jgi:hypothetical protein
MINELVGVAVALVSRGGAVLVYRRCDAASNKPASLASRCFFWDIGGVHVCTSLTPVSCSSNDACLHLSPNVPLDLSVNEVNFKINKKYIIEVMRSVA